MQESLISQMIALISISDSKIVPFAYLLAWKAKNYQIIQNTLQLAARVFYLSQKTIPLYWCQLQHSWHQYVTGFFVFYAQKKTLRWDLLLAWSKSKQKIKSEQTRWFIYRLVIWVNLISSVLPYSSLPSLIGSFMCFVCVVCSWWVPVAMSAKRYSR